jgi:SAM-dependent methyltransferase
VNRWNDLETVECPICGPSSTRTWLDDGKPTRYVRCATCGTVYASPRVSRARRYDWLDKRFSLSDDIFTLTSSRLPALAYEAQEIQSAIRTGRILDIGCSIGSFLNLFSPVSWERYGVELSPSAADYAIHTYALQVHTGLLATAAYPDGYFNVATIIDTLYYLDDPLADFREINRILKPDGVLAIEIPGQSFMLWRSFGLMSWLVDRCWSRLSTDSSYLFWFNPQALRRLLKKTGFEPIKWNVIPSPLNSNWLVNLATRLHFEVISYLARPSFRTLTWSPKYLCIARKSTKDE